jgi:hypothetical protein
MGNGDTSPQYSFRTAECSQLWVALLGFSPVQKHPLHTIFIKKVTHCALISMHAPHVAPCISIHACAYANTVPEGVYLSQRSRQTFSLLVKPLCPLRITAALHWHWLVPSDIPYHPGWFF